MYFTLKLSGTLKTSFGNDTANYILTLIYKSYVLLFATIM